MRAYVITGAVCAALGAVGAWFLRPARVETRTEYVDRWRTVSVKDTKRVKTRTETKPDGTRVEERTETVSREDKKESGTETGRAVVITQTAPKWHAGALLQTDRTAGVYVQRQLLGPVSVGLTATVPLSKPVSLPTVGVTIGVTF